MESKLKYYTHNRGYVRKNVTLLCNDVRSKLDTFSRSKKLQLLSRLRAHSDNLKEFDEKILEIKWDKDKADSENEEILTAELDACSTYEDRIIESISTLEESLQGLGDVSGLNIGEDNGESLFKRLKPRTVPLPTFSGDSGESLTKFFLNFEAAISRVGYSNYEKYLLLKENLSGRALTIVSSLEQSNQSYNAAKDLLEKALGSIPLQKFETMQRLLNLKLSHKDPFLYVSEIKLLKECVSSLNINVDFMLQFFFWRSMSDSLRDIFIQITNTNFPSLSQLEDNMFIALERDQLCNKSKLQYSEVKSGSSNTKVKTCNYALSINSNKDKDLDSQSKNKSKESSVADFQGNYLKVCTLCSCNHPYFRCDKYKNATEKLQRIRELGGCEICAFMNHTADQCKISNLKCKLCGARHFPVLCEKSDNPANRSNNRSKDLNIKPKTCSGSHKIQDSKLADNSKTHIGVSTVQALQAESEVGLVLPTLTCKISDKLVRMVKDTGSQSNLISESLVEACNLKVLKSNVQLTINGFNASKKYVAKIVEVPLTFDTGVIQIRAVTVPDINVKLKLPKLGEVVEKLKQANFNLADKLLDENSTKLADVMLVLGVESSHCIPVCTKVIRQGGDSALLETPHGIMIEGDLNRLLKDVEILLNCTEVNLDSSTIDLNSDLPEFKVIQTNLVMFNEDGYIDNRDLLKATNEVLESQCFEYLNCKNHMVDEDETELNKQLSKFVFENSKCLDDGRLQMPLLWNSKLDHLLGKNYNLAKSVLKSNLKKYSKDWEKLMLTDAVFQEQLKLGILEEIDDLQGFVNDHPSCSFLPHMSVFKPDRDTTKCRVVYLSNLCENDKSKSRTLCHNQVIHPGPNMNGKLSTALILLRFDRYLLCFDISRAFLNIALSETDQARLLILWVKNVSKENYTLTAFKAKRLPFGISCSPSILMMALYKILVLDDDCNCERLTELKRLVYSLFYMDNGSYSSSNPENLRWAKLKLEEIFGSYCFNLQQWVTNDPNFQAEIDRSGECTKSDVKLFGLCWNRLEDTISTKSLYLDPKANTKRLILKTLAANFDLFGFQAPLLGRAKLFIHDLQCNKQIGWDHNLGHNQLREWQLIAKQVNNSPCINIQRFVGERDGRYKLIGFTDASKCMYGTVLYIQNLDNLGVSFLCARNKVINKQLEVKSIPCLEFNALAFGVETLLEIYSSLTCSDLLCPLKIEALDIYSDSQVSIAWMESSVDLNRKLSKLSVFVRNRIDHMHDLCEKHTVHFKFVAGNENPADQISRAVSYKQLIKSNYLKGPKFLSEKDPVPGTQVVTIPCPLYSVTQEQSTFLVKCENSPVSEQVLNLSKFSSFRHLVRVYRQVLRFVNVLKLKVKSRYPEKFRHLETKEEAYHFGDARTDLIIRDQMQCFPECVQYLNSGSKNLKDIPNRMKQLNLFKDSVGIIRVKCKFGKRNFGRKVCEPILLSKESKLTNLIVLDLHKRMNHSGKYALLAEFRKQFYIPQFFNTVKQILRNCTICRRLNDRTIKVNQSPYRNFRADPSTVPYRYMYLDHFGPYNVKFHGKKQKVYVLLLTCLWSRAVNLRICLDLSVDEFLRGFQMHVHEYGMPSQVFSDLGSSIVAGTNVISDFLKDHDTREYLQEHGIKEFQATQYYKGNHDLGGLVESLVKVSKRLLFGALRNNVVDYFEFEFIISDVKHLINKRPVAFKEAVRDNMEDVPTPITPELLIRGYDLPTVNCIPELQPVPDSDTNWNPELQDNIPKKLEKLQKIRSNLVSIYQEEFLAQLVSQATDKGDRYSPVNHKQLSVGDIVLLKEKFTKPSKYPLGLVKGVKLNINDEVTGATIKKGNGEIVKRHVSSLVPLLQFHNDREIQVNESLQGSSSSESEVEARPTRASAAKALQRIRTIDST